MDALADTSIVLADVPGAVPGIVDPLTDARWHELVANGPSDVFHSAAWLQVLADTYGFRPQALLTTDPSGRPVAGIPFCVIEGLPTKRIATPPFSDYCDPIAPSVADWMSLQDALVRHGCRVTVRCLHNEIPVTTGQMAVVSRAKWHGLDLDPDIDDLWEGLHSSARRAIRKARKEGVLVRPARDEKELRAFFELHLRVRKYKYRLLAQPFSFFENIWRQFVDRERGTLLMAILGDRVLGGVFFLEWKDVLYYKFNASDPDYVVARPNDLIIWTAIEEARQRGMTRLDFGLSDWDQEGLVRYKRKYASDEKTISFLRHEPREGASHAASQAGEILPRLTDLFTNDAVPDELTEQAGDLLYGLFA